MDKEERGKKNLWQHEERFSFSPLWKHTAVKISSSFFVPKTPKSYYEIKIMEEMKTKLDFKGVVFFIYLFSPNFIQMFWVI